MKVIKKQQIENKYMAEFENYAFQKDAYFYENDIRSFQYTYEDDISLKPGDFGYNNNLSTKDPFDYFNLLCMKANIIIVQVKKSFYNI